MNSDRARADAVAPAVGKTIFRASLCGETSMPRGLFSLRTDDDRRWDNCFRETLVLWCGRTPLAFDRWADGAVDPDLPRRAPYSHSVTDFLNLCIGRQITGIEYPPGEPPSCLLHLDNGRQLRISTTQGQVPEELVCGYFEIIE